MKNSTLLVLFLSLSTWLTAQSAADVLYLRSGVSVPGTIVRYDAEGGEIVFKKAEDDLTQTYPLEAVEKIRQLPEPLNKDGAWQVALPLAQRKKVTSQVKLRNGPVREGTITDYSDEGIVSLRMRSGVLLQFQDTEIQEIAYEMPRPRRNSEFVVKEELPPPSFSREPAVYSFRETGWFHTTSFAFSFGKREREEIPLFGPDFTEERISQSAVGFNVQHITGYQFSRMLGLGLGASYDAYDLEDGESVLTLMAHYRGYLTKTVVAPYIGLNAGYGFALKNEDQGVQVAEGGVMFHPEIGVRLGATERANFTLGLGYRLQDAYYVQERPFSGNIEYRDTRYQRFMFSLGLLF